VFCVILCDLIARVINLNSHSDPFCVICQKSVLLFERKKGKKNKFVEKEKKEGEKTVICL